MKCPNVKEEEVLQILKQEAKRDNKNDTVEERKAYSNSQRM